MITFSAVAHGYMDMETMGNHGKPSGIVREMMQSSKHDVSHTVSHSLQTRAGMNVRLLTIRDVS